MVIASFVVAVLALFAAIAAVVYAKRSPSKEDLQRVERNTADTADQITAVRGHISRVEEQIGIQNNRQALAEVGENVSITVKGGGWGSAPLTISFAVADTNLTLDRIYLLNGGGLVSGDFVYVPTAPHNYDAVVDSTAFSKWFQSGQPHQTSEQRIVSIRVIITAPTGSTDRTFPVIALMSLRKREIGQEYYTTLTGQC